MPPHPTSPRAPAPITSPDYEEMIDLQRRLENEIYDILYNTAEDARLASAVAEVQPPSSVVRLTAQAAANVLMAYERGYRMERAA